MLKLFLVTLWPVWILSLCISCPVLLSFLWLLFIRFDIVRSKTRKKLRSKSLSSLPAATKSSSSSYASSSSSSKSAIVAIASKPYCKVCRKEVTESDCTLCQIFQRYTGKPYWGHSYPQWSRHSHTHIDKKKGTPKARTKQSLKKIEQKVVPSAVCVSVPFCVLFLLAVIAFLCHGLTCICFVWIILTFLSFLCTSESSYYKTSMLFHSLHDCFSCHFSYILESLSWLSSIIFLLLCPKMFL